MHGKCAGGERERQREAETETERGRQRERETERGVTSRGVCTQLGWGGMLGGGWGGESVAPVKTPPGCLPSTSVEITGAPRRRRQSVMATVPLRACPDHYRGQRVPLLEQSSQPSPASSNISFA